MALLVIKVHARDSVNRLKSMRHRGINSVKEIVATAESSSAYAHADECTKVDREQMCNTVSHNQRTTGSKATVNKTLLAVQPCLTQMLTLVVWNIRACDKDTRRTRKSSYG